MRILNWSPQSEQEETDAIMAWLGFCLDKLQEGKEDEIPRDVFYKSKRRQITDDYVDRVIRAIDDEFEYESIKYSSYHMASNRSGSDVPPEFHRLGKAARRALVEGLDKIFGNEVKGEAV